MIKMWTYLDRTVAESVFTWGTALSAGIATEHAPTVLQEAAQFDQAITELRNLSGIDHDDLQRIVTEHMRQGASWRNVIAYLREQIMENDYRWMEQGLPPT